MLSRGFDLSKMVRSGTDEEAEMSGDIGGTNGPNAVATSTGTGINSFADSSVDIGISQKFHCLVLLGSYFLLT